MKLVDDPEQRRAVAAELGRRASSTEGREELRHELEPFLPLLDPEPRAVVRFINAYVLHRMAITEASPDASARWTIVELRWPEIAERLRRDPAQLDRWHDGGVVDTDPHRDVITSADFHAVVLGDDGLALSASDIRSCVGAQPVIDLTDAPTEPSEVPDTGLRTPTP